ncbi:MAG: polysaccharide biosynthesis C-terminal domain-containing protein, partial [Bacteroidota bacterium]
GGELTFAIIGAGVLFNAMNSVNGQIMVYSKLYRYNLYLSVGLAMSNVFLNWLLIGRWGWGIMGAATATLISLLCYNAIRSLVIYRSFRIHPFTWGQVPPILFGLLCVLVFTFIPLNFHPLLNIFLRSVVVGGVFLLYLLNTSSLPEVRAQWDRAIGLVWKRKTKP